MKNVIKILGTTFAVSATFKADGVPFPNSDKKDNTRHNKFRVTIKTDRARASFDYYGSQIDWTNNITSLDEQSLKNALECFISDACSGNQSFENFCSELGYDEDSRKAERIYKGCVKSYNQFQKLTDADIYDTLNALNE